MGSKIIVLDRGLSNLSEKLFELGHVFQVSPLPDGSALRRILEQCICSNCKSKGIYFLAYEKVGTIAALAGRCKNCRADYWAFFSECRPYSGDIIIVWGSTKAGSFKGEIDGFPCSKCGSLIKATQFKESSEYDFQMVLPLLLECTGSSCNVKHNTIFYDCPMAYFELALAMVDETLKASHRGGLVFTMSALETYLNKAFMFLEPRARYLVKKRKVNFQSLQDTKELYEEYFGIDLSATISKQDWSYLGDAMTKRHCLIHNAGLDINFSEISLSFEYVERAKQIVKDFIKAVNRRFEEKGML